MTREELVKGCVNLSDLARNYQKIIEVFSEALITIRYNEGKVVNDSMIAEEALTAVRPVLDEVIKITGKK